MQFYVNVKVNDWKYEVMDSNSIGIGGFKEIIFSVKGEGVSLSDSCQPFLEFSICASNASRTFFNEFENIKNWLYY